MGTNFTKELLTEIPNARDIWAAMPRAPGLQMTSYGVGGSRTGNQTGYMTYGFDTQNQTRMEGIDTTEGTAANAGYFESGSFEEFQVGGAGSDASSFAGGAVLSISVKSGGDRFSGNWYSDWQGDATISDNVPDNLRTSLQTDDDGFYVREALERGNPIDRQYDINFNVGGPLWKGKAWWFTGWRLNDQYKYTLGSDLLERSRLSNIYTLKGTFQLTRNNQFIEFLNKPKSWGRAGFRTLGTVVSGALPKFTELSMESGVDECAREPRFSRCVGRQLVPFFPASASATSASTMAVGSGPPRIWRR